MLKQKETIVACAQACDFDQWDTIDMYAELDEEGAVTRESNVCPMSSESYANIMWHTAKKRNWI